MKCGFLDSLMSLWRWFGEFGLFWILIALGLIATKKYRKLGITLGLSFALGGLLVNLGLKPLIARTRPYDINTAIELLVPRLHDFSFPSGHTLICAEAATVLTYYDRRAGIPAIFIAIIMAFSRVYLYVHYPSDVLTALVLGTLFGIAAILIIKSVYPRVEMRLASRKQNKE